MSDNRIKKRPLFLCWSLSFISIPLLSFFGRPLQKIIDGNLTAGVQAVALIFIAAGMLCAFLFILRSMDHHKKLRSLLWPGVILFCILLLYNALPLSEKIHVIVFGIFGFLSFRLFGIGLCLVMSGLDELLQYFLADRFGEWRDALLNFVSSGLGFFSPISLLDVPPNSMETVQSEDKKSKYTPGAGNGFSSFFPSPKRGCLLIRAERHHA